VVADYVDDYATPTPAANWQYLWNQNGEFGTSSNYSVMTRDSWRYRPSATVSFPYLGATFAHPGSGVDEADSGGIDRYAIAAFTVTEAGTYEITDSLITRNGASGDGVEVSVHINDQPASQLLSLAPASSGNFNSVLGNLEVGDTIYVGVGPDGPGAGSSKGNDGVGFDFSITLGATAPVTVTVDLETQRFLGDVSELDRDKYFTHHSGSASDSDVAAFRSEYDVEPGRQFWGALPYAKNQTGQVGVYPNTTPSTDQSVRPATQVVHTGHPRDALRYDTDVQAAADWVTTYYTTVVNEVPQFYEPINEPFVHAGDAEFSDAPSTDAMRLKMAQLYAAIGEAVDQTPALANMNVVGYSSAWPSVELWDFDHWDSRMKMFMDVAGEHMDAFSTHLYDGINVTGQNNRRSGSNSEAILDLIETYSFAKWGEVKPHALTEYGGIENGYGETYSDIRSAQSLRSQNHLLFNFLERENDVLISIPFTSDKATWFLDPTNGCEPYSAALFKLGNHDPSDCSGTFEYTWRVHFYDLWQDVKGDRGVIKTSDPDVQAQLFVDGNTAYVAVNNLADDLQTLNLEFLSGLSGLQNVEIRAMEIPTNAALQPTYTETTQTTAPASITLDSGATAVLVFNFDAAIEFNKTVESEKYYTGTHLQAIAANQAMTFDFDGVETSSVGDAILRMSIGRKHDRSKAPEVTVNGTAVDVPVDWKGYDQANRDDFFGMIEIPVPIALLQANNTVEVTFPDSGGRVSSMILNVEAVQSAPTVGSIVINDSSSQALDRPDLFNTFAVSFDIDVSVSVNDLEIRNDTLNGSVVDLSGLTFSYDAPTHTATWSFNNLTLDPAFYTFELSDDIVSIDGNLSLDGDEDGNPGTSYTEAIYVAIPGDANLDGDVDLSDVNIFTQTNTGDGAIVLSNLGTTGTVNWSKGDFNADGDVDISDINIFTQTQTGDFAVLLSNVGTDVRPGASQAVVAQPIAALPIAAPSVISQPVAVHASTSPSSAVLLRQPITERPISDAKSISLPTKFLPLDRSAIASATFPGVETIRQPLLSGSQANVDVLNGRFGLMTFADETQSRQRVSLVAGFELHGAQDLRDDVFSDDKDVVKFDAAGDIDQSSVDDLMDFALV